MKTVISLNYFVNSMLADAGLDIAKIVNACQSEANKSTGLEGESKRSAFKGGRSYSASGELKIKDLQWKESTPTDYTAKTTAPLEFIKWNDSIAAHFRKCGNPHGSLSLDTLPSELKQWVGKFTKTPAVSPAVSGKREKTPAVSPAVA
jgi:hypothetical protein